MRSLFTLVMLFLAYNAVNGQHKYIYGLKINPSAGYINSPGLQKNFETQKSLNPQLSALNSHARLRANFGFGVFYEYKFNDKMSGVGELTYNFSNTRNLINYENRNLDNNNTGTVTRISSTANIHLSYFQLPVLFKYTLSTTRRYYLLAGPALNVTLKPYLKSDETQTVAQYTNGTIDNTTEYELKQGAKLDHFKALRFALVMGAGKIFRFTSGGNNLHIDIRYALPLTGSEMYSKGTGLDDAYLNNIYGNAGKSAAETLVPAHKLNNFKLSVVTLSIAYTLKIKKD